MGMDKETTDIWKFGRARPDLSMEQSATAPTPILTAEEMADRQEKINEQTERWMNGATAIAKAFAFSPSGHGTSR